MEDLRWACMSVDLRAVRAALAVGGRSAARPGRAGSTGEPAAKAARPALDLAERDPLAGSTVLHFACNPAVGAQPRAHLPILRLLLSHGAGAFVDERNNVGDTALIVCARQGDSDGLLLLLEASEGCVLLLRLRFSAWLLVVKTPAPAAATAGGRHC